jgi:hypothetical protein
MAWHMPLTRVTEIEYKEVLLRLIDPSTQFNIKRYLLAFLEPTADTTILWNNMKLAI